MTDRKNPPATMAHDHKGAVLPTAPVKAPMPAVKPTEGTRPSAPTKSKD
jgi:hypothetical protein